MRPTYPGLFTLNRNRGHRLVGHIRWRPVSGRSYTSHMVSDPGVVPVLLAEGVEVDVSEWEKATADVLRKRKRLADDAPDSDVWNLLAHETLDGISVTPLGTPSLTDGSRRPRAARPGAVHPWRLRHP